MWRHSSLSDPESYLMIRSQYVEERRSLLPQVVSPSHDVLFIFGALGAQESMILNIVVSDVYTSYIMTNTGSIKTD